MRKLLRIFRLFLIQLLGPRHRIRILRMSGMKIGRNCLIFSHSIPSEPYLIQISDNVIVSAGTQFIPHDGAVHVFRKDHPELDLFGRISIGRNSFIGINSILLPNTLLGENCIVGAGSVVKGSFKDNSVIMGNPGKMVLSTSMLEKLILNNSNALATKRKVNKEKEMVIKKHFGLI